MNCRDPFLETPKILDVLDQRQDEVLRQLDELNDAVLALLNEFAGHQDGVSRS
jgi:hypothetical protein